MISSPAVDIERLCHFYGDRAALDDVTLRVEMGELFGVLGPNGGGKTTLFRILATLLHPTRGTARVLGTDVATTPSVVRRHVGIVFQEPALDDELTVIENLEVHAALHGLGGPPLRERLLDLLALFGLEERRTERVSQLSGGLKRRVDLVRGLIHAPSVLLLDEPTSGLDPAARRGFWEAIERLRRKEGTTLLVATHSMEEADRCDGLAILDHGRIVAAGSPSALKSHIGDETLWIECDAPESMAKTISDTLDVAVRVVGSRVQISAPDAHHLLPDLYAAVGGDIHAATVRRPTLEDVFMLHAGHGIDQEVTL